MSIPPFALVLTAAGSSLRFNCGLEGAQDVKKEFLKIDGHSILYRAAEPFFEIPGLSAMVVTCRKGCEDEAVVALEDLADIASIPMLFIPGGRTRQESVHLALEALAGLDIPMELVAIQDGARPFTTPELIIRTMALAWQAGGAVPALAVTDSIRRIDAKGRIIETTDRRGLVRVQTPQIFSFSRLLEAHRSAEGNSATDDAEVFIRAGNECLVSEGDEANRKITYAGDIPDAKEQVRRYVEERERGRKNRSNDEMFRRFIHSGDGQ